MRRNVSEPDGPRSGAAIFWFGLLLIAFILIALILAPGCKSNTVGDVTIDLPDIAEEEFVAAQMNVRAANAAESVIPTCIKRPTDIRRSALPDANGWAKALLPVAVGEVFLRDTTYHQRGGDRLMIGPQSGPQHLDISGCYFTGRANPKLKWGSRLYGVTGSITCSVFADIRQEHGVYFSLGAGDLLIADCLFMRVGSQAIQFRHSVSPPWQDPHWLEAGTATIERVTTLGCTTDSGTRPAFTFSPKAGGPNRHLVIRDCQVLGDSPYGALNVEHWGSVLVENCTFQTSGTYNTAQFFEYGSKPGVLQAPKSLTMRNCDFGGGRIGLRPSEMETVDIKGCRNGVLVIYAYSQGAWRVASSSPIEGGFSK